MKTIDNFQLISPYLDFSNGEIFHMVQLIVRKKDHPEDPDLKSQRVVRTYFVDRPGKLESLEEEIKGLCRQTGARAYVNLNPKSYRKMAFLMGRLLFERIEKGDFRRCQKTAESAAGKVGDDKWWLSDCDFPIPEKDSLWWGDFFSLEDECNRNRNDFQCNLVVPTPNGFHVLFRPFGPMYYDSSEDGGISWNDENGARKFIKCGEIKKNAPTVLFAEVDDD